MADTFNKNEPVDNEGLTKAERIAAKYGSNMDEELRQTFENDLVDKISLQKNKKGDEIRAKKRKSASDFGENDNEKVKDSKFKRSDSNERPYSRNNKEEIDNIDIREEYNSSGGRRDRDTGRHNRSLSERNRCSGGRLKRDEDNNRDIRHRKTWINDQTTRGQRTPEKDSRRKHSLSRNAPIGEQLRILSTEAVRADEKLNKLSSELRADNDSRRKGCKDLSIEEKLRSLSSETVKKKFPSAVIPAERRVRNLKINPAQGRQWYLREQIMSYREFHKKGLGRPGASKQNEDEKDEERDFKTSSNLNVASTSKYDTKSVRKRKIMDVDENAKILAEVKAKIDQAMHSDSRFDERNLRLTERDDIDSKFEERNVSLTQGDDSSSKLGESNTSQRESDEFSSKDEERNVKIVERSVRLADTEDFSSSEERELEIAERDDISSKSEDRMDSYTESEDISSKYDDRNVSVKESERTRYIKNYIFPCLIQGYI